MPFSGFTVHTTTQNPKVPSLDSVRNVLHEPIGKIWQNYLETERKQGYTKETWQFQSQFQSVSIFSMQSIWWCFLNVYLHEHTANALG